MARSPSSDEKTSNQTSIQRYGDIPMSFLPSKLRNASPEVRLQLASLPYAMQSTLGITTHPNGKAKKSRGRDKSIQDGTNWNTVAMAMPATRRLLGEQVYSVQQEVDLGSIFSVSNATPSFGATFFTLSQVHQSSELTNIFDQYRIAMVELWVYVAGQTANIGNGSRFASVIDYDDVNLLTSFGNSLDYDNVVVTNYDQGHYRKFVPHVAVASYSGTFTSFTNVTSPWIDAASPAVQHYGVKFAAETAGSNNSVIGFARLHLQFRSIR